MAFVSLSFSLFMSNKDNKQKMITEKTFWLKFIRSRPFFMFIFYKNCNDTEKVSWQPEDMYYFVRINQDK